MANDRTAREAARAWELRESLVLALAPDRRCACCRKRRAMSSLEIDHVAGRTWRLSECSQLGRARRYWREYREGVRLRVLCRVCNARDGATRRYPPPARAERNRYRQTFASSDAAYLRGLTAFYADRAA